MENKPTLVFTLPAAMGGVASFNFNIINNAPFNKVFYTKVILLKAKEDNRPIFKDHFNVDECITFSYSFKENQYFVLKRLETLIGKEAGAVVCDNGLTLQACSIFQNPKTVFHLLHDYFYVNQHIAFQNLVDVAIAHSSFFSDCILAFNPKDFANHCFYLPYGVTQYDKMPDKNRGDKLQLFYLGRLSKGKGVDKLLKIEEILNKNNVCVQWTIIGKGELKEGLIESWRGKNNITFISPETTEEVFNLLKEQDVFIFPTEFEGTPVSIMEALSNACVTLVNDLPGGIRDLITPDVGCRLPINNVDEFASIIISLHHDRNKLAELQYQAWAKAKNYYDIKSNAEHYLNLFAHFKELKRLDKKSEINKLSRLDKPYLPNSWVKFIRNLR